MEDLLEIYHKSQQLGTILEDMSATHLQEIRFLLWGSATLATDVPPSLTPQQIKKRVKRLSSLHEDEAAEELANKASNNSLRKSKRSSKGKLVKAASFAAATTASARTQEESTPATLKATQSVPEPMGTDSEPKELIIASVETLMPPPPPPALASTTVSVENNTAEHTFVRPTRAAKLKSEKNLKEPKLNQKLRRPSNFDSVNIKVEAEQRASQIHEVSQISSKTSVASSKSEESVLVVPGKEPSLVVITSDDESNSKKNSLEMTKTEGRQLRVKIKREKVSLEAVTKEVSQTVIEETIITTALKVPMPKEAPMKIEFGCDESSIATTILSATTSTAPAKKGRKKKEVSHKPIKVERFSEVDAKPSPISNRTRKGSIERAQKQQEQEQVEADERAPSVYEDAVDDMPTNAATEPSTDTPPTRRSEVPPQVMTAAITAAINETVTLSGDATFCTNSENQNTFQVAPGQATFIMDKQNPNATITLNRNSPNVDLGNTTFNMPLARKEITPCSPLSSQHSMVTAKDTTEPHDDSLITEDESFGCRPTPTVSKLPQPKTPTESKLPKVVSKLTASANKPYKMPTRAHELFNPLIQSPVKKKVEAFENAAATAAQTKAGRLKRTKENATPGLSSASNTTPIIGKLGAPALGRFLTPTQSSNITPSAVAQAKKAPSSASKAMPFPKATHIATNLKSTNSTSSKTLSRENSAEEFRKGLNQMAEERKKQRDQKHILAAQQREAKERERAERVAKLAKDREEKRLKKQQEAEQKKRECEEIQRKLRQQEEAVAEAARQKAAAKCKAIQENERDLLAQMKLQSSAKSRMLPPPPKSHAKYTFEMLHEDDSTDDEGKTSYKRPPVPTWSRSHVRGSAIVMQQSWPTDIIDSFFSVQPLTADLKIIFPDIDPRHLKRNSSAVWSTPPRYSELPKY